MPWMGLEVTKFTNVKVYSQVYTDIYVRISLGGHNLGTFMLRSWNSDALYPDLILQLFV